MTPTNSAKMIQIVAWGFIAFAIIWGLAPYGPVSAPSRILLDILDWPYGSRANLSRDAMWLSSVGAGLTIAICIMLLGIVVPAVREGNKRVVRVTIWAFVAWFIIDGLGSYASGVGSNAVFNIVLFVAIMVPLVTLRFEDS
ncbi:MAG: hypothetical protein GQ535_05255 [Rhodobacteraceae bacterium]|nr:hypothetical protein [Paracoccaceae bacterium]